MTLEAAAKRRLIELVRAHRHRGLLPAEERELRRILVQDNRMPTTWTAQNSSTCPWSSSALVC